MDIVHIALETEATTDAYEGDDKNYNGNYSAFILSHDFIIVVVFVIAVQSIVKVVSVMIIVPCSVHERVVAKGIVQA